ncbi:MAG: tRNA lysidine(34) synthetase TilS [Sideroxydans sp.]|nr:tRNA lysidine(34) synthetase TilS [Sideroxydans sp.]
MASSRKSNLAESVAARLAPLLPAHSSILIGLSGGMDSVVLLHLLHQLAPRYQWQLSALHVHHGISPNADAWAEFCAGLCARLNIPLHIEHVNIAPLRDEHGIEAAARKLRHAAFEQQACDFVALAHHADDQAETVLLQLLRGAGIKGAAAMPEFTPNKSLAASSNVGAALAANGIRQQAGSYRVLASVQSHATVRPLLDIRRAKLFEYAQQHALQWVEDESNTDDHYPRNFLRQNLLPLLEKKFPSYRETLTRAAQNFAEASELLDELAQQDAQLFPSPAGGGGARGEGLASYLELSCLRALSLPRAKNLLRYFLHSQSAPMPQTVQLDQMLHQLLDAREDATLCVTFGGWQVRRYQDKVYTFPAPGEFDPHLVLAWSGEAELAWPALNTRLVFTQTQGQGISLKKLQQAPVTLRLRNGGETLRPHPKAAKRSLKNLLQQHDIPPWQRERLPLLYCGDELVSVVGVAIAAEFQAIASEAGIVVC